MKLFYLGLVAVTLSLGCGRSEAPKPVAPPQPAPPAAEAPHPAMPPGHPPIDMRSQTLPPGTVAEAANPQWTVPSGWQPGKPSSVRRASFQASGAEGQAVDIAVTAFPGDVGGLQANVDRWRAQIGLTPATAEQLAGMTTKLDINGLPATIVDFTNATPPAGKTSPQRVVVATISNNGNSWFFKMAGDAPLVEAQKAAFLEFVKAVKF